MSWPSFWEKSTNNTSWQSYLLKPLSLLICAVAQNRRKNFLANPPAKQTRAKVIVVGNIVVGGTGKTPFIIWLAKKLAAQNIRYGIVSRGYGGTIKKNQSAVLIDKHSIPQQVGDEPVLFAKQLACPIAVSPNRPKAIELLEQFDLEVIISDDGLQHYAMARDIEIMVFDGQRGVGNGLCMPAGPLRESVSRINEASIIVSNGDCQDEIVQSLAKVKVHTMNLKPIQFRKVNNPAQIVTLETFKNQTVHAIAGIGNPARFYQTLANLSIKTMTKDFADHQNYQQSDFNWKQNAKPLLMTEKDAVKCQSFAGDDWWYLEIQPVCEDTLFEQIREVINGC